MIALQISRPGMRLVFASNLRSALFSGMPQGSRLVPILYPRLISALSACVVLCFFKVIYLSSVNSIFDRKFSVRRCGMDLYQAFMCLQVLFLGAFLLNLIIFDTVTMTYLKYNFNEGKHSQKQRFYGKTMTISSVSLMTIPNKPKCLLHLSRRNNFCMKLSTGI